MLTYHVHLDSDGQRYPGSGMQDKGRGIYTRRRSRGNSLSEHPGLILLLLLGVEVHQDCGETHKQTSQAPGLQFMNQITSQCGQKSRKYEAFTGKRCLLI